MNSSKPELRTTRRLDVEFGAEFDVTNVSNNVYRFAKGSEEVPSSTPRRAPPVAA